MFLGSVFYCKGQEKKSLKNADTLTKEATYKTENYLSGYIVMRTSGDTILGFVNRKQGIDPYHIRWIDFKTSAGDKSIQFMSDSVIAFKYGDEVWRCFIFCKWSKLIIEGPIKVYMGCVERAKNSSAVGFNISKTECLAFKKGNEKAKFIEIDEVKAFSSGSIFKPGGILKIKTKDKFKDYISDSPEALAELVKETFRYEDLEALIIKYNTWAKMEKK